MSAIYNSYKHLLNRSYVAGRDDCYGLVVKYFHDIYGIHLTNFARPDEWWLRSDMNLITDNLELDGWKHVNFHPRSLRPGDGLLFSILQSKVNHVGIYVGNSMFIHHQHKRYSTEDPLVEKWQSRLLGVVRHPEVEQVGMGMSPKVNLVDLLPESLRAKIV